jgi:hypothetical protein
VFSPQAIHYLQFVGRGYLEYIRGSWVTTTKENTASGLQVAFVTYMLCFSKKKRNN